MSMGVSETEELYERLAQSIDTARDLGPPEEMESLFLAKLAFTALRELSDPQRAEALIALCLEDIAPSDK